MYFDHVLTLCAPAAVHLMPHLPTALKHKFLRLILDLFVYKLFAGGHRSFWEGEILCWTVEIPP